MLGDGTYDAFVVEVEAIGDDVRLELAVTAGPFKGQVVAVRAAGLDREPAELLGLPATVVVTGGHPTVRVEG